MVHYSEGISCRFEVDAMKNFPRTTKLKNRDNRNIIYKFYPGFSENFVEDVIKILNVNTNEIILDPWNGSRTTTYVASKLGIPSI
jgi:DNA modification methylase